jgi:hypothetical protein
MAFTPSLWSMLFNTQLGPEEESNYQSWISGLAKQRGWQYPEADYDMRGYFKKYGGKDTTYANGHFTDEFKKPNHPTFSDQSIYSTKDTPGGTWGKEGSTWTYTPSDLVKSLQGIDFLKQYFNRAEPGNKLIW